jgi:hypothetical protein
MVTGTMAAARRDVWAAGWILVFVAIIISAVRNSNAGANATTYWFALGRNGSP